MLLESTLSQFALSELLSMMVASSVTGVLEVGTPAAPIGRLFCRGGQIYHATAGELEGQAALDELITIADAPFRFIAGAQSDESSLSADSIALVELVRRRELYYKEMREHVPGFDWVPVLSASRTTPVSLHEEIWPVLAAIDGKSTIAQIADATGHDPFEAGAMVSYLIKRSLAAVAPPHAPDQAEALFRRSGPGRPAPPARARASLVEWLLMGR